jgi:predicted nucleic acid-binding Zn ribbon protein
VAQERWAEAVGQRIAEQAAPVAERDGVLVVACHSSVWASELAMLSATLLEKLNRELGGDRRVLGLRFVIQPS